MSAIMKALFQAQGQLHGVVKDAKNPHFKNRYATLEAVIESIKPVLQASGIVFIQQPGAIVNGALEITTRLVHADTGEEVASTMHVPLQKIDPQGVGSATTYGCRYSLMAVLGLPPIDDDAEAAVDRTPQRAAPPPAKPAIDTAESETAKDFIIGTMDVCETTDDFDQWAKDNTPAIGKLLPRDQDLVRTAFKARRHATLKREMEKAA